MPAHALRHDPRAQLHQQAGNIRVLAHEAAVNWRNAEVRAESHAKAMEPGRARWFGRDSSSWTVRQEDWYQARLALLAQRSDLLPGDQAAAAMMGVAAAAVAVADPTTSTTKPLRKFETI